MQTPDVTNPVTTTSEGSLSRLQSTRWIIDARWYYAPLAFFLGMIARDDTNFMHTTTVLIGGLMFVLACNAYFHFALRSKGSADYSATKVQMLNMSQVIIDLVFFFLVLLFTGGGVESIGHSFFFIPIVTSMIIFGFYGAIAVAVSSGFLVLLSVLAHVGALSMLVTPGATLEFTKELSLSLTQAGIIVIIYLMVGFFGGYVSRLIRARDVLLLDQIHKEEVHVNRLEELTREFDQSAKLLVRRDLELTGANEKLTQLDTMKSEIISVVAHQLRTPLSAIKWTFKILLDEDAGPIAPEQRELLNKGFESNERMIILINDMLAVNRLESGKIKYVFVPLQFEQLVQEMLTSLLTLATQKNIRLDYVTPKVALPKIKVDPDKMRDVLQNLIDNAIKYTREAGVVTIGVEMQGEELHFWVTDNGIGIPEEEKDRIFSRFFRANNAVHAHTDGSGLGLFIAASVVKRHGGKIWFESVINTGTTFHVLLPFTN